VAPSSAALAANHGRLAPARRRIDVRQAAHRRRSSGNIKQRATVSLTQTHLFAFLSSGRCVAKACGRSVQVKISAQSGTSVLSLPASVFSSLSLARLPAWYRSVSVVKSTSVIRRCAGTSGGGSIIATWRGYRIAAHALPGKKRQIWHLLRHLATSPRRATAFSLGSSLLHRVAHPCEQAVTRANSAAAMRRFRH